MPDNRDQKVKELLMGSDKTSRISDAEPFIM